jgi:hypothetical protein
MDLRSEDLLLAIDNLDELIVDARPVPLTDLIRLERSEIEAAMAAVADAVPVGDAESESSQTITDSLEELRVIVAEAPTIRFTRPKHIRLDPKLLKEQTARMRSAVEQA